jgi:long-chain acyl-CoA synthetase
MLSRELLEWELKKMIKSPFIKQQNEWNIMDIDSTNRSAKRPIYPTITEDDYEYILNHLEQYIVLYLMQKYSKVNLIKDKVPNLKEVFSLTLLKVVKLEGITSSGETKQSK